VPTSRTTLTATCAVPGSIRYFQVSARVVTDNAIIAAQAANFDHSRLRMSGSARARTPAASMRGGNVARAGYCR
jgi:hypothetical protein